jgi:hypothetical protein
MLKYNRHPCLGRLQWWNKRVHYIPAKVTFEWISNFSDLYCLLSDPIYYPLRHLCTKYFQLKQFQFLKKKATYKQLSTDTFCFYHILIYIWHEQSGPWHQFHRFPINLCVCVCVWVQEGRMRKPPFKYNDIQRAFMLGQNIQRVMYVYSNFWEPSASYVYHLFQHTKTLHSAHRMYCVFYMVLSSCFPKTALSCKSF